MNPEPLKNKKRFMEFSFDKRGKSIPRGNAYFIDIDLKLAVEWLKEKVDILFENEFTEEDFKNLIDKAFEDVTKKH